MKRALRQNSNPTGFTLLEVLLAMSITAIIVVIVFGAFRVSIRAWEKGERQIARQDRIRVVTQLMKKQISSAVTSHTLNAAAQFVSLDGSEVQLSLFSSFALHPTHSRSSVFCRYVSETDTEETALRFAEETAEQNAAVTGVTALNANNSVTLLSGLTGLTFNYLYPLKEGEPAQWQPQWHTDRKGRLPLAIRMEISDASFAAPLTVVIPLRSRSLSDPIFK